MAKSFIHIEQEIKFTARRNVATKIIESDLSERIAICGKAEKLLRKKLLVVKPHIVIGANKFLKGMVILAKYAEQVMNRLKHIT